MWGEIDLVAGPRFLGRITSQPIFPIPVPPGSPDPFPVGDYYLPSFGGRRLRYPFKKWMGAVPKRRRKGGLHGWLPQLFEGPVTWRKQVDALLFFAQAAVAFMAITKGIDIWRAGAAAGKWYIDAVDKASHFGLFFF